MMKNRVANLIINHHGHKATNKFVVYIFYIFGQKPITAYTTNAESTQNFFRRKLLPDKIQHLAHKSIELLNMRNMSDTGEFDQF